MVDSVPVFVAMLLLLRLYFLFAVFGAILTESLPDYDRQSFLVFQKYFGCS